MTQEIINNIIRDAKDKYRDFESPNYSFVSPLLINHWSLYKELINKYSVIADLDFSCDVCIHYYLEKDGNSWVVCASLVGRYAMIARQIDNRKWVVVCNDVYTDPLDEEILQIVKHNFYPLSESMLKTVIPGFRYETVEGEIQNWAYVYQVLFFYAHYGFPYDYDAEDVN